MNVVFLAQVSQLFYYTTYLEKSLGNKATICIFKTLNSNPVYCFAVLATYTHCCSYIRKLASLVIKTLLVLIQLHDVSQSIVSICFGFFYFKEC